MTEWSLCVRFFPKNKKNQNRTLFIFDPKKISTTKSHFCKGNKKIVGRQKEVAQSFLFLRNLKKIFLLFIIIIITYFLRLLQFSSLFQLHFRCYFSARHHCFSELPPAPLE